MKFLINNNTTYNYSYYATRPKWLVETLLKKPLSQKHCETNPLSLKKPFPTHRIAFAPWQRARRVSTKKRSLFSKGDKAKERFTPWPLPLSEGVKTQNRLKTNNFLKEKVIVQTKKTQTKSHTTISQKLKGKVLTANFKIIKTNPEKVYQHLFQTKELLCWTSDLSFFNLRGYFSNILKTLQICKFAVRNNKKILFIKDSSPRAQSQGKLLNPWLVQYKRTMVPHTLSNLFDKSYLKPTQRLLSPQILKKSKGKNQGPLGHKMINVVKRLLPLKEASKKTYPPRSLAPSWSLPLTEGVRTKESRLKTLEDKQNNPYPPYKKRYYQLSGLLNSCLYLNFRNNCGYKTLNFKDSFILTPPPKTEKTPSKPWESIFFLKNSCVATTLWALPSQRVKTKTKSEQKNTSLLLSLDVKGQHGVFGEKGVSLKNNSKYGEPRKKVTIRIDNIIRLWIKEAQTMSQQTAGSLTVPLAGFLTNSKTTFNTVYNLSNYDLYNSVNSNLKPNDLFNRDVSKIKTNRLEKVNFQKPCHLFLSKGPTGSVKTKVKEKPPASGLQVLTTGAKSKNVLKTRSCFATPSSRSLPYLCLGKNSNWQRGLNWTKSLKNFDQKGWWIDYSNSHNCLPLTPNTQSFSKNSESIIHNEGPKPLEYCYFGDVLTWQSKSQKSSSVFYSNTSFSKDKDNVILNLKKQVILEKRGPIALKKRKAPFFTHFKKQLQRFQNLKLKLKGPYLIHALGGLKKSSVFTPKGTPYQGASDKKRPKGLNFGQTKHFFLKKRQYLSKLAKFIIFYLNHRNRLLQNQPGQAKKDQAYICLPSSPTAKTKIKITLNSRNFRKRGNIPAYGYNLALHTPEHLFNGPGGQSKRQRQDKIKTGQSWKVPWGESKKVKRGRGFPKESIFFKRLAPSSIAKQSLPSSKGCVRTQQDQQNKRRPYTIARQRLRPLLFYRYYKTIIALNHLNQYKMFAKTPFVNNQLADIIFFINPEKNQNLVNQANSLKIPTVGIVSGNTANAQGHQGYNNFRLKDSVYYPILGNPVSSFFTRAIIGLIVKFLRVEKSRNKLSFHPLS